MADVLQIQWGQLDMLFEDMQEIRGHIGTLDDYCGEHVCSTAGFDFEPFALKPLADATKKLREYFSDMRSIVEERYDGLVQATALTARDFDNLDGQIEFDFNGLLMGPHPVPRAQPKGAGLDVKVIVVQDPSDELKKPPAGKQQFPKQHDAPFQEVVSGWDDARDKINECIQWCQDHSIGGLSKLPDVSLEDYIVFPLSGDYYAIQQNATATRNLAKGMRTWATNFSLLPASAQTAMQGTAGTALMLHIGLYHPVTIAVSGVVSGLAVVFDELATMSEKIAIRVEKIIRVLGQKLFKLMNILIKRINLATGLFATFIDLAEHGTQFFKDIIADVKTVIELIGIAMGLADSTKEWAKEQADRIDTAHQIVRMVQKLPQARGSMNLSDLAGLNTKDTEKYVRNLKTDFGDPDGKAWDNLEKEVDRGVERAGLDPDDTSDTVGEQRTLADLLDPNRWEETEADPYDPLTAVLGEDSVTSESD